MEKTLKFNDISFQKDFDFAQVHIAQSKTDPFRVGCEVRVWATGGDLCPVRALKRFIKAHPFRQGPLFTFIDGSYLTRDRMATIVQSAVKDVDLNTHSFRIGGASAAAAGGIPDSTIQVLGRWSSNTYRTYLRIPDKTFKLAARAMAQSHGVPTRWDPDDNSQELRDNWRW